MLHLKGFVEAAQHGARISKISGRQRLETQHIDGGNRQEGGPDSMPVLATGRRLAKVLRLDQLARLKMFPIAMQAPWGISPALLPEIPLPAKIRTAFQKPVELDCDPDRAEDERYVESKYEEVSSSIQAGMDALARRRRLPLLG